MHITLVKKILADGQPCAKCAQIEQRLAESGHIASIDTILVADERDANSPGMLLATTLGVNRAPFFVVEDGNTTTVYTVYFKFVKEVLGKAASSVEESRELLRDNPELDLI